jgi:hypothetical protein
MNFFHIVAQSRPNENKISDDHRERGSLEWKGG